MIEQDEAVKFLKGIVDRSMKELYIDHARKQGAKEDWIKTLEPLDSKSVCTAISVIYGEPLKGSSGHDNSILS